MDATLKYSPDQPRKPKGSPEGGQWVRGGGVDPYNVPPPMGVTVEPDDDQDALLPTDADKKREAIKQGFARVLEDSFGPGVEISARAFGGNSTLISFRKEIENEFGGIDTIEGTRLFDRFGASNVKHISLWLSGSLRGKGLSKKFMSRSMDLYEELGVNTVSLDAAQIGSYAWARFGFKPEQHTLPELMRGVQRNYKLHKDSLPFEVRSVAESAIRSKDIWAISDLGYKVNRSEYSKPIELGKALLINVPWSGSLDLSDKEAMARFNAYTGRVKKAFDPNQPREPKGSPEGGQWTTVYHGTKTPGFTEFNRPDPSEFMTDRALGVHLARDPEIANTFTTEQGGVYILKIPPDDKFLEIDQPLLPYIEPGTPKTPRNIISDQSAVEHAVYEVAYAQDPALFERYLKERWLLPRNEAQRMGQAILAGKPYTSTLVSGPNARPIVGLNDYIDRDGVVKARNAADRARAIKLYQDKVRHLGYVGVRYINTSPRETEHAKDPVSYIVFDPENIRGLYVKGVAKQHPGPFLSKKFDPNQPREDKGKPTGGRWKKTTSENWTLHELEGRKEPDLTETLVMWHGTSDEVVEDILQEGLVPSAGPGADRALEKILPDMYHELMLVSSLKGISEERAKSVYITPDQATALKFANFVTRTNPGSKAALLQIDIPVSAIPNIKVDEAGGGGIEAYRHVGNIPPEWISKYAVAKKAETIRLYAVIVTDEAVNKAGKAPVDKTFDPNQPRKPKGSPEGGQWSKEGLEALLEDEKKVTRPSTVTRQQVIAEMEDVAEKMGALRYIDSYSGGDGSWLVEAQLTHPDWTSTRVFHFSDGVLTVEHSSFFMDKNAQKEGTSKKFMAALMDSYEKLGVDNIKLETVQVGSYTWARYGFKPDPADMQEFVQPIVKNRLNGLLEMGRIPQEVYEVASVANNNNDAWALSDLRYDVDGEPLGYRLLESTSWRGSLDLNDKAAMDRFNAYVGRVKKYDPNQPREPKGTPEGGQFRGYHGTFARVLDAIAREGLVPGRNSRKSVYVSDNQVEARVYATNVAVEEGSRPIILAVDFPEDVSLVPDGTGGLRYAGRVPANWIVGAEQINESGHWEAIPIPHRHPGEPGGFFLKSVTRYLVIEDPNEFEKAFDESKIRRVRGGPGGGQFTDKPKAVGEQPIPAEFLIRVEVAPDEWITLDRRKLGGKTPREAAIEVAVKEGKMEPPEEQDEEPYGYIPQDDEEEQTEQKEPEKPKDSGTQRQGEKSKDTGPRKQGVVKLGNNKVVRVVASEKNRKSIEALFTNVGAKMRDQLSLSNVEVFDTADQAHAAIVKFIEGKGHVVPPQMLTPGAVARGVYDPNTQNMFVSMHDLDGKRTYDTFYHELAHSAERKSGIVKEWNRSFSGGSEGMADAFMTQAQMKTRNTASKEYALFKKMGWLG